MCGALFVRLVFFGGFFFLLVCFVLLFVFLLGSFLFDFLVSFLCGFCCFLFWGFLWGFLCLGFFFHVFFFLPGIELERQ